MTFADLLPGDVFLLRWWLESGPAPRAYMVVDRYAVLPNDRDVALDIVRLEAADEGATTVHLSSLEDAAEKGEIQLMEILERV